MSILEYLNDNANLLLVIITAVYVGLTWRMIREMQRTREAELEASLITTVVHMGGPHVKLRLQNVGQGPALDIEARIRLEPIGTSENRTWRNPALLSGDFQDFKFPDTTDKPFDLNYLAENYDNVCIDLHWSSLLHKGQSAKHKINLKDHKEGSWQAGALLPEKGISDWLKSINDTLEDVEKAVKKR